MENPTTRVEAIVNKKEERRFSGARDDAEDDVGGEDAIYVDEDEGEH